ncbi:MAG: 50S ribosomal protein L4 [Candidatus Binatia bacterium]|nr:MAG: 50S ribosomal protein L4 [Candidatus Binatia bacterium]
MSSSRSLPVVSPSGQPSGEVTVRPEVFFAPVRVHLLHSAVRWQLAKRRAGTHSTKTRGEVSGGGKKPWRQKGTGRARAGSIRSPLWVGGAVIFGPKPRDYSYSLPRSARLQALRSAVSAKVKDGGLVVVEEIVLEQPKTKLLASYLSKLGVESALIVLPQPDETIERAGRNLPWAKVVPVGGLNVYDVLRFKTLVTTPNGIRAIEERLAS